MPLVAAREEELLMALVYEAFGTCIPRVWRLGGLGNSRGDGTGEPVMDSLLERRALVTRFFAGGLGRGAGGGGGMYTDGGMTVCRNAGRGAW